MRWIERSVMPRFPPVNPATGCTANPGLTVEGMRFTDARILQTSALWQTASLTRDGRSAVVRQVDGEDGGEVRLVGAFTEGWLVRRPRVEEPFRIVTDTGEQDAKGDPVALVLKLGEHYLRGRLVSATPERVRLERQDRCLVVMRDLVLAVRGADPDRAFGHLADVLVGTRRAPRRRARPLPEGNAEALGWL